MNKDKRGISAVVATVLIILITVAAITIIWAAVIPMIKNQISSGTLCLDAVSQVGLVTDGGYTCLMSDGKVQLQVSHGAKNFDLAGIQVLVSEGGSTTSETISVGLPGANEEKVVVTSGNFSGADKVSIAPIVTVGQTTETCDISATSSLSACA